MLKLSQLILVVYSGMSRQREFGMEMIFIKPIILGGKVEHKNISFVNQEEHIKYVRYWNKYIKELKKENN